MGISKILCFFRLHRFNSPVHVNKVYVGDRCKCDKIKYIEGANNIFDKENSCICDEILCDLVKHFPKQDSLSEMLKEMKKGSAHKDQVKVWNEVENITENELRDNHELTRP